MSEFFTPDFKSQPYWWERTPRPRLPEMPLPGSVDVAVVGSGYTGLCAAMELARGGRSAFALDAADVGWGSSSRNGGQISTSVKPGYEACLPRSRTLPPRAPGARARCGSDGRRAVPGDRHRARWIGDLVAREAIDCDFAVPGCFHAAQPAP